LPGGGASSLRPLPGFVWDRDYVTMIIAGSLHGPAPIAVDEVNGAVRELAELIQIIAAINAEGSAGTRETM